MTMWSSIALLALLILISVSYGILYMLVGQEGG